jgi:hypothetical protein
MNENKSKAMERYTINPEQVSLQWFLQLTRSKRMLPSRVMLHEEMEQRFGKLTKTGISSLGELISILGSKTKIADFASKSGLPEEYLVLLKREAGSYLARPIPLSDFPGIPHEYVESLRATGIRNTKEFFELARQKEKIPQLASKTGIPSERLNEIHALSDLTRITGVGGVFARVVYHAGIRSVREFAETNARTHYKKYMDVIEIYGYAAGHFSEEDIQYCIDYAKFIREVSTKSDKA